MALGSSSVTASWSTALPGTNYRVSINTTDATAGYSPDDVLGSQCFAFDVGSKTATSFDITFRRCNNGVATAVSLAVTLDWIAIADNNP